MRKVTWAALLLVFWSGPLMAEDPYYFHKAGTTREAYERDVNRCAQLAGGARVADYAVEPTNRNAPYAMEAAAIAGLFVGFLQARERRRLVSRVERTCMADKGYKRHSIDQDLHREIRGLAEDQRLDRLFGLVSAETPTGKALVE